VLLLEWGQTCLDDHFGKGLLASIGGYAFAWDGFLYWR
jgi:hypothetical protein